MLVFVSAICFIIISVITINKSSKLSKKVYYQKIKKRRKKFKKKNKE